MNVSKYHCLAYDWPTKGARFRAKVEKEWRYWVEEFGSAPWLRNFSRALPTSSVEELAYRLYVLAVWGFGVEEWVPKFTTGSKHPLGPLAALCKLQLITSPNMLRVNLWDQKIFSETGMYIPCEFGTLDRWLERLW